MTAGKKSLIIACVGLFVALYVFLLLGGHEAGRTQEAKPDRADEVAAWAMSREFVKDRLKAPSVAQFASYTQSSVSEYPTGNFTVKSYVDSQNSFGAMLRSDYTCKLRYEGNDQWLLLSISFD